ncbi:pyridoxal phosphate-dependent aminotransferase [Paracidobacterium acidisoli]|nr:pyridoxal phosphate-dependent aminotransferase [Paracidobacterium acidisoli]MBT9330434.1 pyridoxal phosphate-dependent aminotransferase [Paracidobacterium acidisoli]
MRFSSRTHWDLQPTELTQALHARQAAGLPLLDLTASNPTHCGFRYDAPGILAALGDAASLLYDPDPRGILRAREAVAAYYAEAGAAVSPQHVFLTTSTSEAYSYLFRLLCDPGEEVLIAQPSYPLFDFLAQLDDVRLVPYPLFHDHGWHLDLEALRQRITPRTRAIALVHPNNPTGHFTKAGERLELESLCAEHGLALIVDEVFLDYAFSGDSPGSFAAGAHPVLTFVLSGLSKIAALPQMKAAWIAACGPKPSLTQALDRLEVIADTFLSMNAPIQHALPEWLNHRSEMQRQIRERTAANLAALDETLAQQTMVSRLGVEAGWYAVLRVPALEPDEHLAVRLIRDHGVSVHPGYFFGFSGDGWLILSLLTPTEAFLTGIRIICSAFSRL